MVPYVGAEPLYSVSFSIGFALLGTIFGAISFKRESGFLGKAAFFVNGLLLLLGLLIVLLAMLWRVSGTP